MFKCFKTSGSPTGLLAGLRAQFTPTQRLRVRQSLHRLRHPAWLGTLRRTAPLSEHWGYDRGTPIDRYYIEQFLAGQSMDIRGRVLEIKDSTYTKRFGSDVQQCDALDINPANTQATIIADLTTADVIASATFDCVILTQTLQLIYNARAALTQAHRMLKPDGVLLVTVPCVSRIVPRYGLETDFWRFTPASCAKLFGEIFGCEQVTVHAHGNTLTAIAFLAGMACEELTHQELETHDAYFPVLMAVRGVKRCSENRPKS